MNKKETDALVATITKKIDESHKKLENAITSIWSKLDDLHNAVTSLSNELEPLTEDTSSEEEPEVSDCPTGSGIEDFKKQTRIEDYMVARK